MRLKVLRVLIPGMLLARRAGAGRLRQRRQHEPSSSVEDAKAKYAAPTEAPSDAQQGGDLTVIARQRRRLHRPGRAYYQYYVHGHRGDAVARSRPTRPPTSRSRRRCWRPRRRRSPTTARRSPTRSTATSCTRRRSSRDGHRGRRQVRDRALAAARRAERLRADLPVRRRGHRRGDQGGPGQPDRRRSRHQRDHRAGRHDARDQAQQHDRRSASSAP